jgi:hypothetical protein
MKFAIDDATDEQLCRTIAYEFARCDAAILEFHRLLDRSDAAGDSVPPIPAHDIYSRFVVHLYEFYLGCFQRDRRKTNQIPSSEVDALITIELQKALRHLRWAAEQGHVDAVFAAGFPLEPPVSFASNFRHVQNRLVHVRPDRASPNPVGAPTLTEFYRNYHDLLELLVGWSYHWWHTGTERPQSFGEISNFARSLK